MEKILTITKDNISEYPCRCYTKKDSEGYDIKLNWLKTKFKEGLKIKQLYLTDGKTPDGFMEYVPSENCDRGVTSNNYLFINCVWIYSTKAKNKGFASKMINEVVEEAKKQNKFGVVTVASKNAFMTRKEIFEKNNFKEIEFRNNYSLMVLQFKEDKSNLPKFIDVEKELVKYKDGIYILYAGQCPWVGNSISVFKKYAEEKKIKINFKELKTTKEIQNSPSIYSVFNLIINGKLVADHYISQTRFENILKNEKII